MRVVIRGKQVWPVEGRKGVYWYKFEEQPEGGILYIEMPYDGIGKPDREHPTIVVEIDKEELERLVRKSKAHQPGKEDSPEAQHARKEIERTLHQLGETRKESQDKE